MQNQTPDLSLALLDTSPRAFRGFSTVPMSILCETDAAPADQTGRAARRAIGISISIERRMAEFVFPELTDDFAVMHSPFAPAPDGIHAKLDLEGAEQTHWLHPADSFRGHGWLSSSSNPTDTDPAYDAIRVIAQQVY